MALWKETAQNEQRTMPNEQRMAAAHSEPIEKAEPAPAPVAPVAPRQGKYAKRSSRIRISVQGSASRVRWKGMAMCASLESSKEIFTSRVT